MTNLLNSLKDNYQLGVISNKRDDAVQALINGHFPNIFSFVLGQRDEMKKKPDKEMLEYALNILDTKSFEALYIGDSDVDLDFGFNAKVSVISVSYGFRSRDFLVEKGARYIADDVANLKRFITMMSESHWFWLW
ncbi:MAG: HAD-IA family hydrolase [Clostridium sp.]|nr:MAG: HAD-IA family hydrolase [Clostridium sp.]